MPMISKPTVYGTHGGNHSLHATPAARGRAMRSARNGAEWRRIAPRIAPRIARRADRDRHEEEEDVELEVVPLRRLDRRVVAAAVAAGVAAALARADERADVEAELLLPSRKQVRGVLDVVHVEAVVFFVEGGVADLDGRAIEVFGDALLREPPRVGGRFGVSLARIDHSHLQFCHRRVAAEVLEVIVRRRRVAVFLERRAAVGRRGRRRRGGEGAEYQQGSTRVLHRG